MRRMDYHLHTLHSFDGEQTMDALCQEMLRIGVQEICLTEHYEPGYPDPSGDVPPIWDVWFNEIAQMRRAYPALTIAAGIEIGDNPACRDMTKAYVAAQPFDFRLLSLHLVNGVDPWNAAVYYAGKTRAQAYREYAEAKAESILAWTEFDSVAHIGYVSRYSPWDGEERPLYYRDAPDAFDAILHHIIDLDKCLEVNSSTIRSTGRTMADATIIARYIELGGSQFTFGSDAHRVEDDYRDVEQAEALVRSLGGKWKASFAGGKKQLFEI